MKSVDDITTITLEDAIQHVASSVEYYYDEYGCGWTVRAHKDSLYILVEDDNGLKRSWRLELAVDGEYE